MVHTTAYIDDALDTAQGLVNVFTGLDDLWEDDGTRTDALPAAIALLAAHHDGWRSSIDAAVTTATGTDLRTTLWAFRLDAAA